MKDNGRLNRALPLALALGIAAIGAAHAQVVVDSTVLDQLGPPSDLPALFLNQPPPHSSAEKIALIPPKSMRHHAHPAEIESTGGIHLHPIHHHAAHIRSGDRKAAKVEKLDQHEKAEPASAKSAGAIPAPMTPTLQPSAQPAVEAPAPTPAPAVALTSQPQPARPATSVPDQTVAPTPAGQDTIRFDKDGARLPEGARDMLAHLASRMAEDQGLEVQLLAYAAGDEENASKARRLSLSRALAVRSFLIDQGVRSTRIEVRALGNKVPDGQPDRVDLVLQKRG